MMNVCDNECLKNYNECMSVFKNDFLYDCDIDNFNINMDKLEDSDVLNFNVNIDKIKIKDEINDILSNENKLNCNNICLLQNINEITYCKIDGRPFSKVRLNKIAFNSLFDTGAKISVLSKLILRKINVEIKTDDSKKVSCANGSELIIMGKVRLEVEYNNNVVMGEFFVADEIYPTVIIGIDILNDLKIKLVEITNNNILSLQDKFGKNAPLDLKKSQIIEKLNLEKSTFLYGIILEYLDIFMSNKWDIGKTDILKHRILTNCNPIIIKPRRQPLHYENKILDIIKNLEENDIIKKCESPWNSPIVCVAKKERNEIRMCLDFRLLNKNTIRPAFPIPNVDEMLDSLHGAKYFSSIDLGNAYYQVELEEECKEKTAFSTRFGQYCFNRMPFGIAAAPSTFQKLMSIIVGDMMWKEALVYLDDILIFSNTLGDHKIRLEKLFNRIQKSGLKINPDKCNFLVSELKFLGHIINDKGIKTDNSKIDSIKNFKKPNCIKHLRSFLGLANYYRKFIKNYSKIAKPLESLIGAKNQKLVWTDTCELSFNELKISLTNAPILSHPDFSKIFILDTDASFDSLGAVLSQKDNNGSETIIAYGSKSMNKHEIGYCITRKELLSIFHFTQHFKHYLYGKKFILRTDHKAITFMMTTKKPITAQFQSWINFLSSLDMSLEYRKGELHNNADALSRLNTSDCKQCQMVHQDAKTERIKTRILAMTSESKTYKWQNKCQEIDNLKNHILSNDENHFYIDNNIILTDDNKIYIPEVNRNAFCLEMHKELCHAGLNKLHNYISNCYQFNEMEKIVKDIVLSCDICQKRKTLTGKTKEYVEKLYAAEPFEKLYIDFCGPFPNTFNGKKYIFAIIDQFSKYILLKSVKTQDETTVVQILLKDWILKFGTPKEIHVDRGKCFESSLFQSLSDKYNFTIHYSSPYHHQTNGQIERQFRTIRDWISCSIQDKLYKNWEESLPHIEFAMNSTIQMSIKCSPAEVIFGKKINKERFKNQLQNVKEPIEYIDRLQTDRNKKHGLIKELSRQNKYETDKRTHRQYDVGENVLIKIDLRNKQDNRYSGPHKIINKLHDNSYQLEDKRGKILIRNIEWLKPYKTRGM